jgi:hypothetical protein
VIAYSRPFWPLFLHVLGAMVLFGAVLATLILALARKPKAFPMLAVVGLPAWVLTVIGGHFIQSREGLDHNAPGWVTTGIVILEPGVLVLLATIGVAFWWQRSSKPVAGRILAGLSSVYLLLLAVAWLAMSGKWG